MLGRKMAARVADTLTYFPRFQSSVKEAFASESDAEMQDSPVVDIGSAQAETPIEFDFSDVGRIACLLCQRQFKSAEMMRRHEKESDLHKARILIFLSFIHQVAFVLCAGKLDAWRRTDERNLIAHWLTNVHGAMRFASLFMWICCHSQRNLQDPVTRKLGAERKLGAKMTTAGSGASFAPIGSAGSSTSATPGGNASQPPSVDENVPKYRNRALERRAVFGAEAPGADRKRPERKAFEGPAAPTAAPAPKNAEGIEASNVGSKMLQSMGWTAGSGLGAGGEGRVDPVQAQLYAQGAGLGSSKGHEAGKFEDGWKGYLQQAKEGACLPGVWLWKGDLIRCSPSSLRFLLDVGARQRYGEP